MTTEDVQRKMAAILCADVEGYIRLMQDDPEATLLTLKEYRAVFKHCSESLNGRIVDSPGDNILIEFPMTVDAVQCAVEIQRKLIEKNTELSENRRMQFRIGIDSGDLLEEDGSLYGDGVNISARLQSLAESGGICISGRAHDQVVNRLPLKFEFLGKRSVKNIADPVRVYRIRMEPEAVAPIMKQRESKVRTWQKLPLYVAAVIILGVVSIWYFSFRQGSVDTEMTHPIAEHAAPAPGVKEAPKTIAVLLFDNVSSDPEQDYFAYGLSEEILNSLCQIPGLGVTGKTSSFSFQGTKKTIQEIASDLGVDHILEGSVRKAGNALRITAQLIRALDGLHLWSETYDREFKDIFDIQEDIATMVADKLKLTIEALTGSGGTDNVEAYELYLDAKGQFSQFGSNLSELYNETALKAAKKSIDATIEMDPEFALAWVLKASIHLQTAVESPTEHDLALNAALRALQIEPNLADGYAVLGSYRSVTGEWIEAEMAFRKAIDLEKERFSANTYLAHHYSRVGYLKRTHEIYEKILRDDPFNPMIRMGHIHTLAQISGIQSAEEEYERCRALFGGPWGGDIAITYQRLGANDVLSREDILDSDLVDDTAKDHLDSPQEALTELHKIYDDYDNLTDNNVVDISMWVAYFGDSEFAMDAMEKAFSLDPSKYDFSVSDYIWYPVMHDVRQLPRFKKFVQEIGLVDYWEKFGYPDLCHTTGDGDFECD